MPFSRLLPISSEFFFAEAVPLTGEMLIAMPVNFVVPSVRFGVITPKNGTDWIPLHLLYWQIRLVHSSWFIVHSRKIPWTINYELLTICDSK